MTRSVPPSRIESVNRAPLRPDGDFVLYWMVAQRRTGWNFALQRAVDRAEELNKPLVVLEPLRIDYPWASERIHRFVLEGMASNRTRLQGKPVRYFPYVERTQNEGRDLLAALGQRACLVVTDDYPAFFLPSMVAAAGRRLPVRVEKVDSNGLLPFRLADREFVTAFSFRRYLQEHLPDHLRAVPRPDPFRGRQLPPLPPLPKEIRTRWRPVTTGELQDPGHLLSRLRFQRTVPAVEGWPGGTDAARKRWRRFLRQGLAGYSEARNQPLPSGTSGLSPYLHFGHISVHELVHGIFRDEEWSADRLGRKTDGKRRGWWGLSVASEAFLDQVVTWRELGFNLCSRRDDYDRYDAVPDWARTTLARHQRKSRRPRYRFADLDFARTTDPIWNAAQTQLRLDGNIANYLRMLWGKKILEWAPTPQQALAWQIELNNRYAIDGRDPNSYTGILWTLGRYDRPWGPARPVFGTVRYMSSENTRRKLRLDRYLDVYNPENNGKAAAGTGK
jgi:deoxyribodipyrimidine photo-lyase